MWTIYVSATLYALYVHMWRTKLNLKMWMNVRVRACVYVYVCVSMCDGPHGYLHTHLYNMSSKTKLCWYSRTRFVSSTNEPLFQNGHSYVWLTIGVFGPVSRNLRWRIWLYTGILGFRGFSRRGIKLNGIMRRFFAEWTSASLLSQQFSGAKNDLCFFGELIWEIANLVKSRAALVRFS